jgi:hypothetical protein
LIETPFCGGPSTLDEDLLIEFDRYGFVEETHFTVAYSPVPDEEVPSGIGGCWRRSTRSPAPSWATGGSPRCAIWRPLRSSTWVLGTLLCASRTSARCASTTLDHLRGGGTEIIKQLATNFERTTTPEGTVVRFVIKHGLA